MKITFLSKDQDVCTLNIEELISVDGVKFADLIKQTPADSRGIENRVAVLETAVASLATQWNEFIATATIVQEGEKPSWPSPESSSAGQ